MMKIILKLLESVCNMPNLARRLILLAIDATFIFTSTLVSSIITYNTNIYSYESGFIWFYKLSIVLGILIYLFTSQYKGLTRYIGSVEIYKLAIRNSFLILFIAIIGAIIGLKLPNLSFLFVFWMLLNILIGGTRMIFRDILTRFFTNEKINIKTIAIYGAGLDGAKILASLKSSNNNRVIAFFDDNKKVLGRTIENIPIEPIESLKYYQSRLDSIFLSLNSYSYSKRRKIVEFIQQYKLPIFTLPSPEEVELKDLNITSIKPLNIDDLLGRDSIPPNNNLLRKAITNLSICVTGAAGSIGCELSRQILLLKPSRLIIIDHSEYSLYKIYEEIKNNELSPEIIPILGDVSNYQFIDYIFSKYSVNVVFHAAAYKHVPIVEANPIIGSYNNIFSTYSVCKAARNNSIKSLILISSDKAVRPTNIMGVSKRVSELIVQAFAQESKKDSNQNKSSVVFSMVRFGNVLGSSGSVVPLFRQQISLGGPVTLTNPNVIRYFMTIPEASELVIQASVMAEGGDLFLLDMGEPIKIKDLAKQMIKLSGLSLKDKNNPEGDIEIINIGLRPGEKLYEELLIEADSIPTNHPRIYKANEKSIPYSKLLSKLDELENYVLENDIISIRNILKELVPEWRQK